MTVTRTFPGASDIIAAASTPTAPGYGKGFRVKVTLNSGNTAIYDVGEQFVRKARPDYICADCERSRSDVLMYGAHVATLLPHDGGYRWFRPRRPTISFDRDHFDTVPELHDLCIVLGRDAYEDIHEDRH